MFGARIEDQFLNDARAAGRAGAGAWRVLAIIVVGLAAFVAWAAHFEIEEVTRGAGRVVPAQQLQVVQSPYDGIVSDILVAEGDTVAAGRELMRIDDTRAQSDLGELREREATLLASQARARAEAEGATELTFPDGLEARAPAVVAAERAVFQSRRRQLTAELAVLQAQRTRQEGALRETAARAEQLEAQIAPLTEELEIATELSNRAAVSRVEVLRLRRDLADIVGELAVTRARFPIVQAAILEAETQIDSARSAFVLSALERGAEVGSELSVLREAIRAASDTVTRTALRAPVDGTVNRVTISTIGAVIQAGTPVVEIVPRDDTLLIEASIQPRDIAFIRPGQPASVKITAYDFVVYGALDGVVDRIGADAVEGPDGRSAFQAVIRTDTMTLTAPDGTALPISPGMVAQVDIQTGRKTVLDYLLRPFRRAQAEALRER